MLVHSHGPGCDGCARSDLVAQGQGDQSPIINGEAMASDLDTVRVLRALFNDMPRAPQGLTNEETMAWIQQSMTGFEGGELAYTIEHITRNSMLDIVLRLREDGYLQDDAEFDKTVQQISTPEGRKTFMDWCINAQKSVDATSRLLNRAKRSWSDPQPLFSVRPALIERFVSARPTGAGPLYAEFCARDDVREIGVFDAEPGGLHEFPWGFVVETPEGWNIYVAEVWRRGTVGSFDRFLSAWDMELKAPQDGAPATQPTVPDGLLAEIGIGSFASITLQATPDPVLRRWVGEVFIALMLPTMAGRVLDEDFDFPGSW
jgi:hypothetical protein